MVDVFDERFLRVVQLNEVFLDANVREAGEQNTFSRFPVTACASGFLIIRLDGARNIVVDDTADIMPVDAHAERIGGRKHRRLFAHEAFLRAVAVFVRHARVVSDAAEFRLQHFNGLPRGCVNDGRHLFFQQSFEHLVLFVRG